MLLGYNTNGLADHDLPSALRLVAETGYQCIAITLNHHALNPYDPLLPEQLPTISNLLAENNLKTVVETGARYLLDPYTKHHPTLVSPLAGQRQIRIDFLRRSIDIAAELGAECVSFWSGVAPSHSPPEQLMDRLCQALSPVVGHAAEHGVTLAFEPEPGHFIDSMVAFERLLSALPGGDADLLKLTIDIGHLHCQGEGPIADVLVNWKDRLANLHIEDMNAGVHDHLMFGDGQIDFRPVFTALKQIDYRRPITVELPRHSHVGPQVAAESLAFLQSFLETP